MKKYRIFISGVQKELKEERLAVKDFVCEDTLLRKHFDAFLFEELPAISKRYSMRQRTWKNTEQASAR